MNTAVHVQANESQLIDGQSINLIQSKILYVLGLYPRLNRSMLQTGIGPAISPVIWRPVLEDMIARRLVREITVNVRGPTQRANSPDVLFLTEEGKLLLPDDIKSANDAA